ncbi:hypothetical protein [Labilibaculum euxinus]
MDNWIIKILGLLLILSFSACSGFEQKIIEDIKTDSTSYDILIKTINNCDLSRFSYNQYISREYFPEALNKAINSTVLSHKVEYLITSKTSDCELINIELVLGKLHLRYEPCPRPEFPKPDFYEEVGLIERWGINKNWMIYKDHDFVY